MSHPLPIEFGAGRPACTDVPDPEVFFPLDGDEFGIGLAKRVCAGCPVRRSCLQYALHHDVQGVWGGTTEDERRQMRRTNEQEVA
ncbi:WhiB family transcriptional regulator [Pseudonocardiaceae bacterium YIM PH 21723]|nr:WhiB family transcriptional regulator [Pseudonocardiaceae bacterium YIM PH 21723]